MIRRTGRIGVLGLVGVLSASLITALTATNSVPATRADHNLLSIGPNDLKPAACASITVTAVVTGSGTINGGLASELILGSSGPDTINAGAGNDCVHGGGGDDSLTGSLGTDVCIGGPGDDTFPFLGGCETQIQEQ